MFYICETKKEAYSVGEHLPEEVLNELIIGSSVLDGEYGSERDYFKIGGYSAVVENEDDLDELKMIFNYEDYQCEWATVLGSSGYVSALYILDNDFSVMLFMPESIAPESILNETECEVLK